MISCKNSLSNTSQTHLSKTFIYSYGISKTMNFSKYFVEEYGKKGIPYLLVNQPYVQWGRHRTYRQFAKEAFRYGLGDGESGINMRNFWSHMVETGSRYLFFVLLIACLLLNPTLLYVGLIALIPLSFGLRSYRNAWRNYQSVKTKYDLGIKDYFNSLYLVELSRWYYLRGYLKGLLWASEEVKAGRASLKGLID